MRSSQVIKSVEVQKAKTKNIDNRSSQNYYKHSFTQGSIASGKNASGNSSGNNKKKKKRDVSVSSNASNSSYNRFKNYMYNTGKSMHTSYQSKKCMNLEEKSFFHHVKDRDITTMLLHNKYVNK